MRSILIWGNPSDRADAYERPISGERCARPFSSRMLVVEVLDAEAETRDPHPPDRRELRLRQRPGLALEGDFFGARPRRDRRQAPDQALELRRREKRRGAPAEVHEINRPAGDSLERRVELPLARQEIEVRLDFLRVAIGVDAEVTEMTALPAERNVQVHAERHACDRRRCKRRPGLRGDRLRRPDGEWRVIRHEIAANLCLFDFGRLGTQGHLRTILSPGPDCLPGWGFTPISRMSAATNHAASSFPTAHRSSHLYSTRGL